MGADQHHDWHALAASTLEWWSDAGVDTLVQDEARDWLARPATPMRVAEAPREAPPPADSLPDTLDAFLAWRTGPAAPEAAWGVPMVAGTGTPGAAVMVVIDAPDADGLLTGRAGALFDRMLAAIGLDRAAIYLVPLAAARPIGERIAPDVERRLTPILRHHVALAAPKRLLVLGGAASRAIFGANGLPPRATLQSVNLNEVRVEAVLGLTPGLLIERPAAKVESWKGLQMLVGGLG